MRLLSVGGTEPVSGYPLRATAPRPGSVWAANRATLAPVWSSFAARPDCQIGRWPGYVDLPLDLVSRRRPHEQPVVPRLHAREPEAAVAIARCPAAEVRQGHPCVGNWGAGTVSHDASAAVQLAHGPSRPICQLGPHRLGPHLRPAYEARAGLDRHVRGEVDRDLVLAADRGPEIRLLLAWPTDGDLHLAQAG